ncbi:Ig-like domain repeat protein [Eubacterium limosum]|uniref:Ig-like domain repeat protein n=1 Tax=Eubacterium limosum TaxID=1736 RepID=UPI00106346EC|nr:Ig-like domain repeat protein [Eubacterium limosum]
MKRNEKRVQRMKKAVTLLLITALVLGSVPANVLAAGSARLGAAIAAADENTQEAPAPSGAPETLPETGSAAPEAPQGQEESSQTTPAEEALDETPEAQAAEQAQKAAEEARKAAEAPEEKEAEPLPEGPEIMAVENALSVVEAPETQDAEIGERVVLSANIEAQDPAGVTYQWQAKNGGDAGMEVQSTDEALAQKKASLEAAEAMDLTGITGDESPEAAEAVQSKASGIAEAKTRPIEPDSEGWSDIPGANSTQLAVDVEPETAGAPISYRMVARTSEAAIATPAAMIRTNADFEEGTGTERDPYIITTNQQLWNLHKYEGEASKGKYWRLRPQKRSEIEGATINKQVVTDQVPFGQKDKPFMGTLDGDGYAVTDFVYMPDNIWGPQPDKSLVPIPGYDKNNRPITLYGYGLFGYVKDATIVNLNSNIQFYGSKSSEVTPVIDGTNDSVLVVASIAVAGENATIENCANFSNVSAYNDKALPGESRASRYAMVGGLVGCGTIGDGYSVHFTGTIHNSVFKAYAYAYSGLTRVGTIYPNTTLAAQYRPALRNVYSNGESRYSPDAMTVTPGATVMDFIDFENVKKCGRLLNEYVANYDAPKRLNNWDVERLEIKTRGLLNFKVSDYITTYDGSPQKATVNCTLQESQRGREWDYAYKNDIGETVDEDSVKMPGTYDIQFENKNNHYYLGKVESTPADTTANPLNARMIVNPIADQEAPVCSAITYTQEGGSPYPTGTWTDQDVTVTFDIDDFTKGGNYDTVCDTTPYTVDQEGHEISGVQEVTVTDAGGTQQTCTQDTDGRYRVTLHVDENQQLTTTLTASIKDGKGNTAAATTEPIKINKSDVNIEVTAQKDNDEQPVSLTSGLNGPYSLFARQRIRFDVQAGMDDASLYVNRIEYKFVPADADEASVAWTTTDYEDQQNPHSINMVLEKDFDGVLYIHAASANGKEATTAYKVMLEAHEPAIQNLGYMGYKGQTESGSTEDTTAPAGYTAGDVYHKVDLNINYEDTQNEKSGIVKAEIYRADNNALLDQKDITPATDGRGQAQGTVALSCEQNGSYAVKIVLTDRAGNTYTRTTDTLNIERAVPALDIQWKEPVAAGENEENIYGFDKWCDQNVTLTLKLTNHTDDDTTNDLVNPVDYYYRRVPAGTAFDGVEWTKMNQAPLSPTESLDAAIRGDGDWQYEFKAVTAAKICNTPVQKNIKIDTSPLDSVAVAPEDMKAGDATDIQTTPNSRGWFTEADRSLNIKLSLANNGPSDVTGHYKVTRKDNEAATATTVEESIFTTPVGQPPQTKVIDCAQDGIYEVTVHSTTASGRFNKAQTTTYRVDRTKPELSPSQFIISDTEKKELRSWIPGMTSGTRYYWFTNQQGKLEINAKDTASGVDKIEYQICNDIDQADPAADGVWQVYDPNNQPVFAPEFKGNVFIRVTDKAGRVVDSGDYSHSSNFYLDNQKPTVEITADKDLSQWQTEVTFNVTVKDAQSGISQIELNAENNVKILSNEIAEKAPEYWEGLGLKDFKAVKDDATGLYSEVSFTYHSNKTSDNRTAQNTLKLTAKDNSGNETGPIEKTYKIDTVAPEIDVTCTDNRAMNQWYNESPGFTIKNKKQAESNTDDGSNHTLSGVRYYYKTWKSGETEPNTWTAINDNPTDKPVSYTYPDEALASVKFRAVSETGAASESADMSVQVDRTNPDTPKVVVKNKDNGKTPDGSNGWYKGAWPTIDIEMTAGNAQKAPESTYYKLYTGDNGNTAQTATIGQSILNSSFAKNDTSPGTGEGGAPGISVDNNNQKDQLATTAPAEPADPAVSAEGAGTYEPPDIKESNTLTTPDIKVLNLYPGTSGKVLINWMKDLAGAESSMRAVGGGSDDNTMFIVSSSSGDITIDIRQVSLDAFNGVKADGSSPDQTAADKILKKTDGTYAYDLIYVGAADSNGSQDIADYTMNAVQDYMNAGNGFLVGHDAFTGCSPNVRKAMESLANITPAVDGTDASGKPKDDPNYSKYSIRTTSAKVAKPGKITTFPFEIKPDADRTDGCFDIQETHVQYQFAKGDVWVDLRNADGTEIDKTTSYKGETGTSNFYLTTNGNVGMSQVGHKTGYAELVEKKLLVNTIVSLAQKPTSQFATATGEPQAVDAIIRTADQLKKIGLDSSYPANGIYVLGDNITIDDSTFTGIEDFAGSFDGGKYKITFIGTNANTVFKSTTETARVMNFDITNGQLVSGVNKGQLTHCTSTGAKKPLVGVSNAGTIAYCSVTALILGESGIVPDNTGTIRDCKVTGQIRSKSQNVGGIAGQSSGIIQNCEYSGTLIPASDGLTDNMGGIAGTASGSVTKCKTSGTLGSDMDPENVTVECAGGIVGLYSGKALSDCENAMTVKTSYAANVGGIAGKITSGSISSCQNTGTINGQTAGGIAGTVEAAASIRNTFNDKAVTGTTAAGGLVGSNAGAVSDSKTKGSVSYAPVKGGAVGINTGSLVNCYADPGASITPGATLGGFVGQHTAGTINTCATTANSFAGTNYESVIFPEIAADGVYTLEAWSKDAATKVNGTDQNTSGTAKETIMVDTHGPAPFSATVENNTFTTLLHSLTFGLYFDKTTDVVLEAKDDVSGVASIDYSLYATTDTTTDPGAQGGTPVETKRVTGREKATFSVTPNFKGYVYATATDKAGNTTQLSTDGFIINSTLPRVKAAATKGTGTDPYNGDWTNGDVKVALSFDKTPPTGIAGSISGNFSQYEYSIDNGVTWQNIDDSNTYFTVEGSGETRTLTFDIATSQNFMFRAVITGRTDSKGFSETTMVSIKIDKKVPTVQEPAFSTTSTLTTGDGYAVYGQQPTVTLTAADDAETGLIDGTASGSIASGLQSQTYKLTGSGADKDYTSPLAMEDGKYDFEFTATDRAGSSATKTAKFIVDTMTPNAPKTEAKAAGTNYDGSWTDQDVTITAAKNDTTAPFSGYAGTTGIQYAVYKDGALSQDWQDYTAGGVKLEANADGSKDGAYTVRFKVVTNAGHESAESTVNVNIQKTAPTLNVAVNGKTSKNDASTVWTNQPVTLEVSTNGEKLYGKKNTETYAACTNTHDTITVTEDGITTWRFKAENKSKIEKESDVYKIALDQNTPDMPEIKITKDSAEQALDSSAWYDDTVLSTLKIADKTTETGDVSPRILNYRVYKNDAASVPGYTPVTTGSADLKSSITDSGTWVIEAYTQDEAGNASAVTKQVFNYAQADNLPSLEISFDKTAVKTLEENGGTPVYSGSVNATITARDDRVGIKENTLQFKLVPDTGTRLRYDSLTRYTGPVEIKNFKGSIVAEVENNAGQKKTVTQRICADSEKPSVHVNEEIDKPEKKWAKESFSLQLSGGVETKSGFERYEYYDAGSDTWIDFTDTDRINTDQASLWNNVKYDVTQNGKTLVKVRSVNNAGIASDEAAYEVWKDDTEAKINIEVVSDLVDGEKWSKGVVFTPKLTSTVPPSGVDYYYRKGADDPWKKMAGKSLTIKQTTPEAGQAYEFKAVSGTGRESAVVSQTAFIDGEKPKTPLLSRSIAAPDGQNGWYITQPVITIAEAARETDSAATGLDIDDERRSAVETEYQLTTQGTALAAFNQYQKARAAADAPAGWTQGSSVTPEGEGTYNLMARGKDRAENVSDVTAKETIKVDTANPTIETNDIQVSSLTGGSLGLLGGLLFNDTIEVSVTAKDTGSGVHQIRYALEDGTQKTLTADGNGRVSFRLSPKQGAPLNTSLTLTAIDLAGRESAPATIDNLLLEADKPEVSITPAAAPNDKGWYKGVLPYTVTARDSDAGLASVKTAMVQNSTETEVANDTVAAADSKKTNQHESTITQSGSAQRVRVEAKDRAGNTQTVEKTFKVETAAPALGVSFTLMDGADTAYSAATSYDICAALTYDEPVSGVEDLQVSTDNGITWSSVSDALGKKHVITSETNANYQFRLVTNAGNVSAATAAQNVVINRKMPDAPAIEVRDADGNILNEAWSSQNQTATVLAPSCDDAGVRQATEYQYQTYKDSTADNSRTGTIAPTEGGQSVALTEFTEEGEYTVRAWSQQKDSGLQDTENICEAKVMVDKTPPDASQTNVSFFMDNGRLKLGVLISDALSGGGRADYTITAKGGSEGPLQTVACDDYSQAVLDVSALGAGDSIKIKKVYDKAGNSAEQTVLPDLTIPDNIDLTKVILQITPGETAIEDWYHNQPLTANAHITVEGGSKPEDIKDTSGTVLKTYPAADSITKVDVTYPDNHMVTLDYTQTSNSGQTTVDVPLTDIAGEGENLILKVTAYDAWDNSTEAMWKFKNDVTAPDKPSFKLTTSDGELGGDGKTEKDVTLTVVPDYTNENQTDSNKKKTSPLSGWQYSLDGGVTWSEQYPISRDASSLSRVIASEGGLDTDNLVVRIADLVGNTSVNSDPKSVHVLDTTCPVDLSITEDDGTSPVDSAWDNRKADRVLKVHAADPVEGVISYGLKEWNYSLDGGTTWQTANIPWNEADENTIPIAEDGIYAVTFKVWDAAGNWSQLDSAATVRRDQTAPEVKEQEILFEQRKGADNWIKAAIHWLSFGNFFNDTIRVTVPVNDAMSGNHSLTYSVDDISTEVVVNDGKAVFTLPVNGVKDQTLAVCAKDIAGNKSKILPVKGEGQTEHWTTENSGPVIGDSVTGVTANAAGWYTEDTPVSIRVEDMDSGLAVVSWQLNDEPEQTVMPSEHERKDSENIEINITEDGVNTLTVRATDNAGNTAQRSYSFKLDHGQELAAYITELSGDPVDSDCWRGEETVRLKANMAVGESDIAAWEYTLDGGQTWTDPRTWGAENILEIKEDGVYSQPQAAKTAGQQNLIAVRVTDLAGNQVESPYESIKKDCEAPAFAAILMDEANGNVHENVHWYKDRKPSVRLVPETEPAGKAPVTHTFTLNGEPVVFDSETELRELLKEGENILRVYAKDAAGNEAKESDQNYVEKVFYMDTEMPQIGEISFKDMGNNPIEKLIHWLSFGNFFNEAVQVTIPVTDTASGCETLHYSVGGQTAEASVKDGRASFEIPMDTNAKVTCYAEDMAGNATGLFAIGKESGRWVVTRKIEVPDLWINGEAADGGWYNQPVSFELLVSCPEAGINSIKQTVDNGEPVILEDAGFLESLTPEYRVTGTLSDDGIHGLQHVITDNAGNTTQRGDFIKIDQTAPKGLAINGAPQNGETPEPQTLTVLADDSVEGIDASGLKEWSYTLDGGKTWTEPQLWNQNGENTITVKDARDYDISFKVWDHAGNVSELGKMEGVRFTITSDKPSADGNSLTDGNLLTKVTTVLNPVTGLYFTTGQLMGLAGCLMAITATFMVSLIWYRKNRRR